MDFAGSDEISCPTAEAGSELHTSGVTGLGVELCPLRML